MRQALAGLLCRALRDTLCRIALAALVIAAFLGCARATDPDGRYANNPQRKAWFDSLHSGSGVACCADYDGHPPEAIWDTGGDSGHKYRVKIEGEWYDVPDDAVIQRPNEYGDAVVWYYWQLEGGKRKAVVRCFLPGTLT